MIYAAHNFLTECTHTNDIMIWHWLAMIQALGAVGVAFQDTLRYERMGRWGWAGWRWIVIQIPLFTSFTDTAFFFYVLIKIASERAMLWHWYNTKNEVT